MSFSVVQASVSCKAPDGSTILSVDNVACTFLPGSGGALTGWTSSGFSPSTSTSDAATFTAGAAGGGSITAAWKDIYGADHSQGFSYTILPDPTCTPGILTHDAVPPQSAYTTLNFGDQVTCSFPSNFGAADDQVKFFNGFTDEAVWSATDWFTPLYTYNSSVTFTFQQGTDRDLAISGIWMDATGVVHSSSYVYITPVTATIMAQPANPTNQTSASFSFSATDPDDLASSLTFACKLDDGSFSPCTSPQSYSGLAAGSHTFTVHASDPGGFSSPASNTSPDVSDTWLIDTTAPVITASATAADGKAYTAGTWTNQAVTVSFTCADTGSVQAGIATDTVAGATVSSEGANQSVTNTGSCIDKAGNQATPVSFGPIDIDTTAPLITASATTADGKAYSAGTWTNQAVTVTFRCADTGSVQSGIATDTVAGTTVSSETSGQTVTNTGSCIDKAGNSAQPASFGPIKIDETAPVITASATTADGKPYTPGTWANQAVTVSFSCADTGSVQSAIATDTVAGQTLSSQTSSSGQMVTNSGSCIDNAGNQASPVSFGPILIDTTPPTLSCTPSPANIWPNDHALHPLSMTVDVQDSLSGPNGFTLLSAKTNGSPSDIQGFTAGQPSTSGRVRANKGESYTLTYQGQDEAGNTANCTVTVTVAPHPPS